MASSVGDVALRPLQRAMKLANRAIQLDTGNVQREAYVEYIRSVNYISQCLLEEAEQNAGSGSLSLDCQKMLKLAEQCLERACTTAERLGQAGVHCPLTLRTDVHHLSFPHASSAASATSRLSSLSSISPSSSHRRTCSDETQKLSSFPPPEIFQMLLAAEVQRGKKELTPLEEASIQNQKLKAAYEVRLARLNPRQAAAKTSLTLSLQRQMMENLVIAKAREETLQRKAEERRQRLKEESNRRFSLNTDMTPEMEEQRVLYTAVLEYEQDHEWPKRFKQKIKGNPADTDLVSSFMCQVLSTPDHPVSKLLTNLQCQIYSRVYPVIIKDPMEHNHGTSDVFHQSLPTDALPSPASNSQHLKSSQSLQCLPSLLQPSVKHSLSTGEGFEHLEATNDKLIDKGPCDKERENSFEDLEHCLSPTEYSIGNASLTASALLKAVVKEIHNAKDLLLSASLLDLPPNTIFKDVCVECIDESFFPPIWPALLALYRHVLLAREESLLQAMKSYRDNAQSVVGVPQKLFPEEVEQPYKAAVEEIGHLPLHHTPQRKMECIVRTMRVICECAEEYCTTPGTSAMYLIGEDGYCLTSLLSALSYVESLPLLSAPST
uniref:VPS9 domain-containing 1 n=1 Tax=Xenopus tropicalis TaxID=8364 RepID=A0A7D9NKH5_XENTR